MATLKQRLHRKNASGTYDVVHMETSADMVLMTDGKTKLSSKISAMDTTIAGKAASSHTHPAQTTITGNAGSATKLATARTIRTNLASTTAASFNGTANITPGVTGILPVANGGTGVTSLAALRTSLNIPGASKPSTAISVGGAVSMAGVDWICVHQDSAYSYLMFKYVILYIGHCMDYKISPISGLVYMLGLALGVCNNPEFGAVTFNGFPEYCYIAPYWAMNGGFSYFDSNAKRVATTRAGTAVQYVTSEAISGTYGPGVGIVAANGSLGIASSEIMNNGSYQWGFRPCVALRR